VTPIQLGRGELVIAEVEGKKKVIKWIRKAKDFFVIEASTFSICHVLISPGA
jgi:hypothetical protein